MMKKTMQISISVQRLKALISEKGALTKLEGRLGAKLKLSKDDPIKALKEFLKDTTDFQDKHLRTLTQILHKLETKRPELFVHYAILYDNLKTCGREQNKSSKHKTGLVVNKATKTSKEKENPKLTNVFVNTYLHETPQPLNFIKRLEDFDHLNFIEKKTVMDAKANASKFINQNFKNLQSSISKLREEMEKS